MNGVTLGLALLCAALIIGFRPAVGICIYAGCFLLYPQALTVLIGTVDFNTGRILVLVLFLKALCTKGAVSSFRWSALDAFVILSFLADTYALTRNVPADIVLVREGGVFVDVVLAYFATRLIIRSKQDLFGLIKTFVIVGVPLAFLGAVDAKMNYNPYDFFSSYYGWGLSGITGGYDEMRHGFYRASGSFGNSIIFGMYFAAVVPMLAGLWNQGVWKKPAIGICAGILMMGLMSSMSSAPLSSIMISAGVMAAFRFRKYWPAFAAVFVCFLIFVEVYSNRHFYHVLTGFAFSAENAYYRIGLVEEAFGGGMKGHWLFGYGYVGIGPGNFNDNFTWDHMDLVNIYIRKLARTGLFGLIPFFALNALYYVRLYRAGKAATNPADLWLVWCFFAALVGWNIAMLTVSALSQVEILLWMFMGICQNLPLILVQEEAGGAWVPEISRTWLRRQMHRAMWGHRHG